MLECADGQLRQLLAICTHDTAHYTDITSKQTPKTKLFKYTLDRYFCFLACHCHILYHFIVKCSPSFSKLTAL